MYGNMTPLYDGQDNHYKKMLDLQEKLRKSEEERIRLEERFNIMVQESRNRHQDCINKLRIRYVEFLEEQRARNERNNKLLGTLDKVDSSLALMTAKTERLNVLRRQYEAYLLRVYGNQRANGSVTADSGLESQNDREVSPSPVFAKVTAKPIPASSLSGPSPEIVLRNYKPFELDESMQNLELLQKATGARQNLSTKFAQAAASAQLFSSDPTDFLRSRTFLPSDLDTAWMHPSLTRSEARKPGEISLMTSTRPAPVYAPADQDLDRYIGRIKRLHANVGQSSEHSFEEADHEQNTSGDLLNASLSEDGLESSPEEKLPATKELSRLLGARQAFASKNYAPRTSSFDLADKARNAPVPESRTAFSAPTIGRFKEPEVPSFSSHQLRDLKTFAQEQAQPLSQTQDVPAKRDLFEETRRLIHQNRSLLEAAQAEAAVNQQETKKDQVENEESDREEDEKQVGDGCIEDDYDDTVDIDSWMPDDVEQQIEEVQLGDEIRPRRKLESIEEVEPSEDEEPVPEARDDGKSHEEVVVLETKPAKVGELEKPEETLQESNEEVAKDPTKAFDTKYANNQQYYEAGSSDQQQYQTNAEFPQNYDDGSGVQQQKYQEKAEHYSQQEGVDQQQYQYDPNYIYDPNADYSAYNQQYADGQWNQYYDPNQQYPQDPNQEYQQYAQDPNQEYQQYSTDPSQYDPNQVYDYSQQQQAYNEGNVGEKDQIYDPTLQGTATTEQQEQEYNQVDTTKVSEPDVSEKSEAAFPGTKDNSKNGKKKKDVIKSILDSDTESFIERNLSNTESDFDFN